MVIDADTGALRWTPDTAEIGEHFVAVKLADSFGAYSIQEFTLKVTGENAPPEIVSTPKTKIGVGETYNYTAIAIDPERDPLTFNLGSSPTGMSIHPLTGKITWTPTTEQVGTQQVEVRVIDRSGAIGTQTFTTVVATTPTLNLSPKITSTPLGVAQLGSPYTYAVKATDPDRSDTISYQLLAVPNGMAIDPVTGLLTWANPTVGNHSVVVGLTG